MATFFSKTSTDHNLFQILVSCVYLVSSICFLSADWLKSCTMWCAHDLSQSASTKQIDNSILQSRPSFKFPKFGHNIFCISVRFKLCSFRKWLPIVQLHIYEKTAGSADVHSPRTDTLLQKAIKGCLCTFRSV